MHVFTTINLIFFIASLLLSITLNSIFLKYVNSFGNREIQNNDGQKRWGSRRKPSIGGVIFFIVFLAGLTCNLLINPISGGLNYILGLMLPATLGFIVGFFDDAYNTVPFLKFFGQLLCAILFIWSGLIINISTSDTFNHLVTIFWVVGMMNSINMLDNMDGIVTSTTIISLILCLFIPSIYQNNTDFCINITVIATLIGFLFYNWHPSKMYMGDTGSQFLGLFVAWITIKHVWGFKSPISTFHLEQIIAPILLLIVPIMDTTTVIIRRLMRGQSPFVGGSDHTTHHLAVLGLSDRQVVYALSSISLISGMTFLFFLKSLNIWSQSMTLGVFAFYLSIFIGLQFLYNKAKNAKRGVEEETLKESFNSISSN
jgi:UDP-GlcNAc:undecaprenyl-phosphate GlcNAc-1-phosphate transferase